MGNSFRKGHLPRELVKSRQRLQTSRRCMIQVASAAFATRAGQKCESRSPKPGTPEPLRTSLLMSHLLGFKENITTRGSHTERIPDLTAGRVATVQVESILRTWKSSGKEYKWLGSYFSVAAAAAQPNMQDLGSGSILRAEPMHSAEAMKAAAFPALMPLSTNLNS